jgi:hypothetical protein
VKVSIFHNVARECRRCGQPVMSLGGDQWAHTQPGAGHIPHFAQVALANFDGYKPGQPLVRVFEIEITEADPYEVAGWMFEAFNAPEEYLTGSLLELAKAYRERQLRSLSVGDVVAVGETPLVCARFGWEVLAGEVNEVTETHRGTVPLVAA